MKERLLLIDGHNLLFRMFYGMPDEFYTGGGVKFNAVYGFTSAMAKVVDMIRPPIFSRRLTHPNAETEDSLTGHTRLTVPTFPTQSLTNALSLSFRQYMKCSG